MGAYTFGAQTALAYLSANVAFNAPTRAAGDILVMLVTARGTTTISTPTGWTLAKSQTAGTGSDHVLLRIATNTSADNITRDDVYNNSCSVGMMCFSGDVPSTLTGIENTSASTTASSAASTVQGITTTVDGCACFYIFHKNKTVTQDGATTGTITGGFAESSEITGSTGNTTIASMGYQIKTTAGAIGTTEIDYSVADWSDRWGTITFALTPADPTFALTLGATEVEAGGTVSASVSPAFGGTITGATLEGGDSAAVSAADADSATLTIPAITQYRDGGTANTTDLGTAIDVTVTDGTDTSEVDTLTITVPDGWYLVTVSANFADLSAEAKQWAHASTVIGDKYLLTGTYLIGVTTDLETGFDPGTTEFTHVRWNGTSWGTAGTYDFDADVPQVVETNAATYEVAPSTASASVMSYTITPVDQTISAVTLASIALDITGASAGGDTSVVLPVKSDFLESGGTYNAVPWGTFVTLNVAFKNTATDISTTILFEGPEPANTEGSVYWWGQVASDEPTGIFSGWSEGDGYHFELASGVITSWDSTGDPETTWGWSGNLWRYTSGAWADQGLKKYDSAPPQLVSALVNDRTITLRFDEAVVFGSGGNGGWTLNLSGGPVAMTYVSGDESDSLTYSLDRVIQSSEFGTIAYTQPTDGILDYSDNEMLTFTGMAVQIANANERGSGQIDDDSIQLQADDSTILDMIRNFLKEVA